MCCLTAFARRPQRPEPREGALYENPRGCVSLGFVGFRIKIGAQSIKLPTDRALTIGRASDCWLQLDGDMVSRVHAELVYDGARVTVRDRGSRNGTFVNGQRADGVRELHPGDQVTVGGEHLVLAGTDEDTNTRQINDLLSQTMGMGDEHRVSGVLIELTEKSLKLGRTSEAARYLQGTRTQLSSGAVEQSSDVVGRFFTASLEISRNSGDLGALDKLLHVYAALRWVLAAAELEAVEELVATRAHYPGDGLAAYEDMLRQRQRAGDTAVSDALIQRIASIRDAH